MGPRRDWIDLCRSWDCFSTGGLAERRTGVGTLKLLYLSNFRFRSRIPTVEWGALILLFLYF